MCRDKTLTNRVKVDKTATYQVSDSEDYLKMITFIDEHDNTLSLPYDNMTYMVDSGDYLFLEFDDIKVIILGKRLGLLSRAITDFRLRYTRRGLISVDPAGPQVDYLLVDFGEHPMTLEEYLSDSKRKLENGGQPAAA